MSPTATTVRGMAGAYRLPAESSSATVWSLIGGSTVVAYAEPEARASRRQVFASGATTLDPPKRYLVLAASHEYYRRDIGCRIGTPLFCESSLG